MHTYHSNMYIAVAGYVPSWDLPDFGIYSVYKARGITVLPPQANHVIYITFNLMKFLEEHKHEQRNYR